MPINIIGCRLLLRERLNLDTNPLNITRMIWAVEMKTNKKTAQLTVLINYRQQTNVRTDMTMKANESDHKKLQRREMIS